MADAAQFDVLPGQGRAAVAPLLSFAGKPEAAAYREVVAGVLGEVGPDPRAIAFLADLAGRGEHGERCAAVKALGRVGPGAVPTLLHIARDPKQNSVVRRLAIEGTAGSGADEVVGPFLLDALRFEDADHRWAAAAAIGRVGYRAALPALRRRAEDEGEDMMVRTNALRAYVTLVDPAEAREFLRGLRGSGNPGVRHLATIGFEGLN